MLGLEGEPDVLGGILRLLVTDVIMVAWSMQRSFSYVKKIT